MPLDDEDQKDLGAGHHMFSVVNSTITRFFFLFNFFFFLEELEFCCLGKIFNRNFGNENSYILLEN